MNSRENVDELAIFTGIPFFDEKFYVGRPNLGDRQAFMERLNDLLDRRWLTNNGCYVQELESRMAKFLGVKHCIAMCNATIALEITIRALGMSGEVIVPSFTFIATPHSLQWQQITPVFCDIDPETHNLDPDRVEELITPRTSGIIGVHVWGRPCAVEKLTEIAQRRGLRLMFDAAHAFSCSHGGKMVGAFGDAEVFSFHATKFFNSFEGGAVTTDDDELAQQIRLMKNFGFSGYDTVTYIGTNGKMSEVSAAMGLTSLDALDQFIEVNRSNYNDYVSGLAGIPGISVIHYDSAQRNNYQYVILEVDESIAGINRDALMQVLHAENIIARRYFFPGCHQMEPYRSYFPHSRLLLPQTELLVQRVISLPTGTSVNCDDINNICSIIRSAVNQGPKIAMKLSSNEGLSA